MIFSTEMLNYINENHNLTFSPLINSVEFGKLNINFKERYPVAQHIFVWVEAISPDVEENDLPYYALRPEHIRNDGFTLFITKYDPKKVKVHYRVIELIQNELERGEA